MKIELRITKGVSMVTTPKGIFCKKKLDMCEFFINNMM